jgi:hypothetical protein
MFHFRGTAETNLHGLPTRGHSAKTFHSISVVKYGRHGDVPHVFALTTSRKLFPKLFHVLDICHVFSLFFVACRVSLPIVAKCTGFSVCLLAEAGKAHVWRVLGLFTHKDWPRHEL